jgi:anthranilate phosphoribosyltransferase
MIREAIVKAVAGNDLTEDEMIGAVEEMMTGEATPSQVAALLTALRIKGEAVDEIAGMARVMREKSLHVEIDGPLLDTCSTGGGSFDPFNISTAAAFVCAGAGLKVAKHGNRGATSVSGSADVLEALGAKIELTPEQAGACIEKAGFGFLFAQAFHPAMRFVGPTRREIGIRTIFNIVAPLTNPAGAAHQLLGVGDPAAAPKLAQVLSRIGSGRCLVVHGDDGLDEVSLSGTTQVYDVNEGSVRHYTITPEDAGLERAPLAVLKTGTAAENADTMRRVLGGETGPVTDVVLLNAAAGLLAAGQVGDLREGVAKAREAIDSGAAQRVLDTYVSTSQGFSA